jgi:hypothetical protein
MRDVTSLRLRIEESPCFSIYQAASAGHTRGGTVEIEKRKSIHPA